MTNSSGNSLTAVDISEPSLAFPCRNSFEGFSRPLRHCNQRELRLCDKLCGNSLTAVDISDPASPSLAGTLSGFNEPPGIAISGNYAFVTNYSGNSLTAVDISNPASPSLAGTLSTGFDEPYGIAISGNYAFVTNLLSPVPPVPTAPTSFHGKMKKNDFGLVKEYFIKLTWSASTSSDVQGYRLYRDGVLITTLSSSTLSYEDHNLHKNQLYVYSLVAFNSSGTSTPVTLTIK